MKKTLLFIAFSGILWFHASANNIRVTGIQIAGQDTLQNTIAVNFNLSWENSWRLSTAPVNWDAAWVFIKYRLKGAGSWQHAKLSGQGHTPGSRAALELGLQNQGAAYHPVTNPALGAFIYADSAHEGTFTANGVSLKWDYGASGVPDNAGEVEIRVFAIEMVLVPDGNFHLGSGGAETNRFHSGGNPNSSFLVMGEQEISIGTGLGQLYYTSDTDYAGDRQGPIPAAFPKGFRGFYSMKYEISQQQYADFLNTLNEQQLSNRLNPQDFDTSITGYAFEVQRTDTGFVAQRPNSACNFISVEDALAYSDWSGLRPMSEMEFEKAARGPLAPVPNEFAWGDTTLAKEIYGFSNSGQSDEQISSNYQPQLGNAAYANTAFRGEFRPPYRVGIFAGNAQNSGRRSSGSGYWGVMELSGGVYEVCVTIGSPAGRQFTGQHGDGAIDSLGRHNVADWSGDATMMYSLRGGTFSLDSTVMRTSDRSFGGRLLFQPSLKRANRGFRAVRSAALNISVPVVPGVSTTAVTSITTNSATSGGTIASDGGAPVTSRGVVWSTSPNPTVALSTKTSDGTGTGSFTSQISGLTPNTTYYVRAYATNSVGTAYGNPVTFQTLGLPVVSTLAISDISTTTATSGGNITSDGGAAITARGVVWSTEPNPTIALSTKTSDGTGVGSFTSQISGLTANTAYYVRAYATNSVGTAYGNPVTFQTLGLPVVSTLAISDISATTATSGGNITSDGGAAITARGVVWGSSPNPTVDLSTKTSDGTGSGSFTSQLTGLVANTTYYIRAYATNSAGTAYGNPETFQTLGLPVVSTLAISDIRATTATSGGNITSDGGAAVTARGVVWGTSSSLSVESNSKTTDGTGTGSFLSTISGLVPGTTYYVMAYATNQVGTAYGEALSFTTLNYPSVTTEEITFTEGAVLSGGTVTSDGGAPVNVRGIVWSTASNPTTALATKTSDGSGTGAFTSTIPGLQLQPNIRYYVRAYAVNSLGTAYGEEYSFVIEPPSIILVYPFVSTNPVSSISFNSAVSGGHVAIGNDVTARGVVWSTAMMPTIDLPTKTNNGTGLGPFTSTMTGLKAGTRYYARAYATNYVGTSYGEERGFKTMDTLPTVRTLPVTDIDKSSAISGGEVIFDGGAIVTARGVVWDTLPNPTVKSPLVFSSPWTIDGTGIGTFTSSVTRLGSCKTYYLRAYATNAVGTSYGEEVIFKTLGPPDLRTVAISNAQGTSATTGGNITDDCGAAVTARGVVWSTTPDPTVASATSVGNITSNGTGKGSFTSQLTGLLPNTQYYVRAYATNSVGTAYGDGISFTTTVSNCGAYIAPGVWKEFMCHNLGAANPDADPFTPSWEINGGYWQWGRAGMAAPGPSGPSAPNSGSISGWNTTDAPNGSWSDAVKTANDPCPSGYRVPTRAQWAGVISNNAISNAGSSWTSSSTNYSTGKRFGDRLFLPAAGGRYYYCCGSLFSRGLDGYYWSSSEDSSGNSWFLYFNRSIVDSGYYYRRSGLSLRCITE